MDNVLNWDNLKLYNTDQKKSFEELCYQIAIEEYKDQGVFTRIDDSGGGDGVEFYLTLPNGDDWGWQAKFFGRLDEGGRKEQIKKSLLAARTEHPKLKKWILCNKTDFTKDEKEWFENTLPSSTKDGERVLPVDHDVKLLHWGGSDLLNFLRQHSDIYKYFFSEKLLTKEWFRSRYDVDVNTSQIKAKYESQLHIQTDIDNQIIKVLGGTRLSKLVENVMDEQQVSVYSREFNNALSVLHSQNVSDEYKDIQLAFREFTKDKFEIIDIGLNRLNELRQLLQNRDEVNLKLKINEFEKYLQGLIRFCNDYDKLTESHICDSIRYIREEDDLEPSIDAAKAKRSWYDRLSSLLIALLARRKRPAQIEKASFKRIEIDQIKKENSKRQEARDILFKPFYSLKEYAISSLEWSFKTLELISENELHISGNAGMGKTHVSFNIYEDQIVNQALPAIFIFARDLRTNEPLDKQIRDNLGVNDWTFDEFLGALEVCAKVNKVRIPIIIDGLNESTEWQNIWNRNLERLIITIKKSYPHLVVITTYRTSYEAPLFPKGYFDYKDNRGAGKIRSYVHGFEGLTWEAIQGYFDHYKIILQNYSDAIGEFKNPLYLKLFCETKNPNRERDLTVSFQNEDLFEVFEEYINNSSDNITNYLQKLDAKYDDLFVENKLLKLAEYIWINNSRGMPRQLGLLSNDQLRIFEGENLLIYRDWNQAEHKEEIQFTYDLLAGYIISKYLIGKHKARSPQLSVRSNSPFIKFARIRLEFFVPERWIKHVGEMLCQSKDRVSIFDPLLRFARSREFKKKLLDKRNQHPLFNDILRSISILLIKERKIFLFHVLRNKRAKRYSTESIFEVNSKYIRENESIVKGFVKKEFLNEAIRGFLFDLSRNIELDTNHPLNFSFWSNLLKELPICERDLSWSEYIRKNYNSYDRSYFTDFVLRFESACKENKELSDRIHIAAKKVMWVLTTNIRQLRDEATRALYYYARRYPKIFLELLEYSLSINDPYVPERMLAGSYGLAMAMQNDLEDDSFKNDYLPEYARTIFANVFGDNATFTTTHILARDYAKRTIDVALIHHPGLLTPEEQKVITYPLSSYPHRQWRQSKDRGDHKYREGNAPIHMDFSNYTIGRLIRGRDNYDGQHSEYKEVLSNIYWRIYDIGYSLDRFGEIDKMIARSSWSYSRTNNARKIDRYGKKYSWIAYYEMAGYRSDLGLLKGWNDEDEFRISDVDIDPSFPIGLQERHFIKDGSNSAFLGDISKPATEWCNEAKDLDITKYLNINEPLDDQESSDWILLKAIIGQKDADNQKRDVHISINAVLLDSDDFSRVKSLVSKYQDYRFEYIRPADNYYLFEGEIPWSDLMPFNGTSEFTINYNYRTVKKTKTESQWFKGSEKLTAEELSNLEDKVSQSRRNELDELLSIRLSDKEEESIEAKTPLEFLHLTRQNELDLRKRIAVEIGYVSKEVEIEYFEDECDSTVITMETSVFENAWESYHSEVIPSGETKTPSKEICTHLNLFLKPQSSDLYDQQKKLSATAFKDGKEYDNGATFVYVRKDSIEKYLKDKKEFLLWFQWSEKRYFAGGIRNLSHAENEYEHGTFCQVYY
ncbi:MAG TPA: hypothetical protein VMF88_04895 [Bacteroidota bacterium]|nr:hypothetical protein [Bacteroidota bacterium]